MTQQYIVEILGKDKTAKAFKSVQSNVDKAKRSVLNLRNAIIALGAGAVITNIVQTTARFQDLRTSLTSVTGSAEAGAEAFDFITKFATRTQFSVEDLTRTFIKLKAAGITPTEELLNTFTNTAAITTDQIGSLEAVTDLFARTVSGGLGLEEINRLGDRGVPVLRILEEQLGLTRLEISEFGKTAEGAKKITDAFAKGIQEEFGDATTNLLGNLNVSFSNLGIAITAVQDKIGQGMSPAITELTNELTELVENNEELAISLGENLGKAIKEIASFGRLAAENIELFAIALAGALAILSPKLTLITGLSFGIVKLAEAFDEARMKALGVDDLIPTDADQALENILEIQRKLNEERAKFQDPAMQKGKGLLVGVDKNIKILEEFLKINQEYLDAINTANETIEENTDKNNDNTESRKKNNEAEKEAIKLYNEMKSVLETSIETYRPYLALQREEEENIFNLTAAQTQGLEDYKLIEGLKTSILKDNMRKRRQIEERNINQALESIRAGKSQEVDFENMTAEEKKGIIVGSAKDILSNLGQINKQAFEAYKAYQIAEATINAYKGASNAMASYPPPLNFLFAGVSLAQGLAQVAAIRSQQYSGRALGGRVQEGSTYMVGEQGPEMFVPRTAGSIIPNKDLKGGATTVNVNVYANDTQGFDDLLVKRRSVIVNVINDALNRQGKEALV